MQDRLFTIHQVADLCGATSTQVLEWIRRGWLSAQRLPDGPLRIGERALIGFFKRQGIDIMQLMISTAVKDGPRSRARGRGGTAAAAARLPVALADPPAEPDAPPPDAAEPPPPAPEDDEDLAVRQMLSGARPMPPDAGFDEAEIDDRLPPLELPAAGPPADSPPPQTRPGPDERPAAAAEEPGESPPAVPETPPAGEAPAEAPAPVPGVEAPADCAEQVALAVLEDAVARGASHVHIESRPSGPVLRLRVDGVLRVKSRFPERLPKGLAPALVERLLSWAGIEPAEADRPQAGRFTRPVGGGPVTFEVSSFPTTDGPRVVLAVGAAAPGGLERLGLAEAAREPLEQALADAAGGLVLAVSPAPREADALLRALAASAAAQGRCVLTVEGGPAGPAVPGAAAGRVAPLEGYTYSAAARAALEQDADVLLLARLREPVTAAAAVEAALEGRTVLAGVRAGGFGEAVEMLTEMDLEPWPLSAALSAAAVLRTARRLCEDCRRRVEPAGARPAVDLPVELLDGPLWEPVGCGRCGGSGYAGRLRLAAVVRPDGRISRLVRSTAGREALELACGAADELRRQAAGHLKAGRTSLEEIARIL